MGESGCFSGGEDTNTFFTDVRGFDDSTNGYSSGQDRLAVLGGGGRGAWKTALGSQRTGFGSGFRCDLDCLTIP